MNFLTDKKSKFRKTIGCSSLMLLAIGASTSSVASIAEITRNQQPIKKTTVVEQKAETNEEAQTNHQDHAPKTQPTPQQRQVVESQTSRPNLTELKKQQEILDQQAKIDREKANQTTRQVINYNDQNTTPPNLDPNSSARLESYILGSSQMLDRAKTGNLDSTSSVKLTSLHGALMGVVSDKLSTGSVSSGSLNYYNSTVGCINSSNNQTLYNSAVKLFQMHNNASGNALNDLQVRLGSSYKANCM